MDNLRKTVFDSLDEVNQKSSKIKTYISIEKEDLYDKEALFINTIVKKLSSNLPRETFSCKRGILMYSFEHKDKDREAFISPDVYLIDGDCIVYEVINHQKYYKVTNNQILISREHKYFCEIPLKQFLQYVSAEDIVKYIEKYLNKDFEELISVQKRSKFVEEASSRL